MRDPPPDNRWQRGDAVDALYLADSEETAWAEWYRHLAERAIPPLAQMPREMWTWQVDAEVADLSTEEKLEAVGLHAPAPSRNEWGAYQQVGEQLATAGWPGLLAPSAARPDGTILCLFRAQLGKLGVRPIPPPQLISEPPPPPAGLRT
jgi:RES domain-containing protein